MAAEAAARTGPGRDARRRRSRRRRSRTRTGPKPRRGCGTCGEEKGVSRGVEGTSACQGRTARRRYLRGAAPGQGVSDRPSEEPRASSGTRPTVERDAAGDDEVADDEGGEDLAPRQAERDHRRRLLHRADVEAVRAPEEEVVPAIEARGRGQHGSRHAEGAGEGKAGRTRTALRAADEYRRKGQRSDARGKTGRRGSELRTGSEVRRHDVHLGGESRESCQPSSKRPRWTIELGGDARPCWTWCGGEEGGTKGGHAIVARGQLDVAQPKEARASSRRHAPGRVGRERRALVLDFPVVAREPAEAGVRQRRGTGEGRRGERDRARLG